MFSPKMQILKLVVFVQLNIFCKNIYSHFWLGTTSVNALPNSHYYLHFSTIFLTVPILCIYIYNMILSFTKSDEI